jgi:serine/threonine protein phosphatase 1
MTASRRFAIPDIHGCARSFRSLVHEVLRLERQDHLYLLGDMIDRGPASKEVVDEVLRLRAEGFAVHPLRGNHEEMLLNACVDRAMFRVWMLNGGGATLASFGVEDPCELARSYRAFFAQLPTHIILDDFVLVHAGLNFMADDPFSDTEAMLWSRWNEVDRGRIGGRRLVCGHTPQALAAIRQSLGSDRIMLDNGCVYGAVGGLGTLTALELDTLTLHTQQCLDSPIA